MNKKHLGGLLLFGFSMFAVTAVIARLWYIDIYYHWAYVTEWDGTNRDCTIRAITMTEYNVTDSATLDVSTTIGSDEITTSYNVGTTFFGTKTTSHYHQVILVLILDYINNY